MKRTLLHITAWVFCMLNSVSIRTQLIVLKLPEEGLAARHIAYDKVQEKLGNDKLLLQELERATELEPNPETYTLLAKAYESRGMQEEAAAINKKLSKLIMPAGRPKRILRPKRVVI
jgi:tetratricopeptide (TPR) repeat protein